MYHEGCGMSGTYIRTFGDACVQPLMGTTLGTLECEAWLERQVVMAARLPWQCACREACCCVLADVPD